MSEQNENETMVNLKDLLEEIQKSKVTTEEEMRAIYNRLAIKGNIKKNLIYLGE